MIPKVSGRVAATAIAAAVVAATPVVAQHGAGMRTGRQVFAGGAPLANPRIVGGFHAPACCRHPRQFHNFAFVARPMYYAYGTYGNYCWQQVWTPSGWQWADVCAGDFAFTH
ncbi:MAG: hypothetical protein ACT4O2_12030 [Beijerinckiaceae bacterium]